jgi:sugar lactone lactonase YvrE
MLVCVAFLSSCVKEEVEEPIVISNLAISSIKPISGPKNTTVTILGVDFSPNLLSNKVTLNGLECSINNASSTSLSVTIPRGAGTGNIVVNVGKSTQTGPVFTYEVTPSVVSTLAGSIGGFLDATGALAQFSFPQSVTVDAIGNVYVADYQNHRIRKITATGVVTTIAGSTAGFLDATGTLAQFNGPVGIKIDANGNLYVSDLGNHKIRKITPAGLVSTLAGSIQGFAEGAGSAAQFSNPYDLAVDGSGNVYVADDSNNRIRKITPTGVVTTLAGSSTPGFADGTGNIAQFNRPVGIAADAIGNVYVADFDNHKIRKITPTGVVTTLAGSTAGFADGTGTAAQFSNPRSVAVDAGGNVYVADQNNYRIRKITPTGIVTTLAGSATAGLLEGIGANAQFNIPVGITVDNNGNLYIADVYNNRIRKITQD